MSTAALLQPDIAPPPETLDDEQVAETQLRAAPLFTLEQPGDAANGQSAITPARAGVDYDAMRKAFPNLPTSVFEGDDLKAIYAIKSIDLTNATQDFVLQVRGNVLSFLDSTNLTDRLLIRYQSLASDQVPFKPGMTIDGMYYDTLYISWAATAGATATLFLAYDPRNAQRSTVG